MENAWKKKLHALADELKDNPEENLAIANKFRERLGEFGKLGLATTDLGRDKVRNLVLAAFTGFELQLSFEYGSANTLASAVIAETTITARRQWQVVVLRKDRHFYVRYYEKEKAFREAKPQSQFA